jgi:hypothetical protein
VKEEEDIEEEEDDVNSYWVILREREDSENLIRKHKIALC